MLKVGVIGTGYVGLVTGACLSDLGHRVVCVDTDETKIARLRKGDIPIYEPGLQELVAANSAAGRLSFGTQVTDAVRGGVDVLFIAVGTPTSDSDGGANLDYVFQAAADVGGALAALPASPGAFTAIVTKSTVPLGTSWTVEGIIAEHISRERFATASNPEFMREGSAIEDFLHPDRIVIGSHSEAARKLLEALYLPLTRRGRPLVATSIVETAELIKYAANAFLATKVAFINELAQLCEASGADVRELSLGVGLDRRIGTHFFTAGPGFGGSCFPKDLRALIKTGKDFSSPVAIVESVIQSNERHKAMMVEKIRRALDGRVAGRRIAVLGLAFKANTDDMRDAPALTILPPLIADGADIVGFDPIAAEQAAMVLPDIALAASVEAAVAGADAAVIITEWDAFRDLDWRALGATMRHKLVIDLRNIYEPEDMAAAGVGYVPLGGRSLEAKPLEDAAE